MVSNIGLIADTLRFDREGLIKGYLTAVKVYEFEDALGRLVKLVSLLSFAALNLALFTRGRLLVVEVFDPTSTSFEAVLLLLSVVGYCYGSYLTRDKNRYQLPEHSDLAYLRARLLRSDSDRVMRQGFEITDYLDRDLYILLANYVIDQGSKGGAQLYSIPTLLNLLDKRSENKELLARMGLDTESFKLLVQRAAAEVPTLSEDEFERLLKFAFLTALKHEFDYFDSRAVLIALLLHTLRDLLAEFGIADSTINALLGWLRSSEYRENLLRKIETNAVLKPFSTVNSAMTSVYSEVLEANTDDITNTARLQLNAGSSNRKLRFDVSFREREVAEMISILDSEGGLCLLVGEVGVGKSTIIETLALQMLAGELPRTLRDKRLLELNVSRLLSAGKSTSEMADLIQSIFTQQARSGNIVMVIDDIDQLLNLQAEMQKEVISTLSAELRKAEVKLVATIAPGNYAKYVKQIPELDSLFDVVQVEEATIEQSLQLLLDELKYFERKHRVKVQYGALQRICQLAPQYEFNKHLPDKAIDALDQIMQTARQSGIEFVNAEFVDEYLEKKIGLKLGVGGGKIDAEERELLENLEAEIRKYVVGQAEAVDTVAKALRRARVGFGKDNKPIAAFLFYGPTGVGKTELSKTIARVYFGDEELMLRLDMSEFQSGSDIDKLLGHMEGNEYREGQLTQYVLQHPFSLILLDELEKADTKVIDLFLQVLDNARLTDGAGRDISFANTIIVATSNAGSKLIADEIAKGRKYKDIQPLAFDALKQYFRVEFINRFDAAVMFHPLTKSDAQKITEMLLFKEKELLKEKGIEFIFSSKLIERIVDKGFNQEFGARSLKREITSSVSDIIADALIKGEVQAGDIFSLD